MPRGIGAVAVGVEFDHDITAIGSHTVRLRVREWSDADAAYRYGDWTSKTFELEASPAPAISDF